MQQSQKESVDALDAYEYVAGEQSQKGKKVKAKLLAKKKLARTLKPLIQLETLTKQEQVDYWNSLYLKYFEKDLTEIEINEKKFKLENFEKSKLTYEAVDLSALPNFLKEFPVADPVTIGAPCILIISMAAIRAVDVIRAIPKDLKAKYKIGKLFAKHKKREEQNSFLQSNLVKVAVGTPARLINLLDESLKTDCLQLIVIDTARDPKERNIFEMIDTRKEILQLVNDRLLKVIQNNQAKICFY